MAEHDAIRRVLSNYEGLLSICGDRAGDLPAARAQLDALLARQAKLEAALREIAKDADLYDGPLTPEEGIIKSLKGLAAQALAESSAKEASDG